MKVRQRGLWLISAKVTECLRYTRYHDGFFCPHQEVGGGILKSNNTQHGSCPKEFKELDDSAINSDSISS